MKTQEEKNRYEEIAILQAANPKASIWDIVDAVDGMDKLANKLFGVKNDNDA